MESLNDGLKSVPHQRDSVRPRHNQYLGSDTALGLSRHPKSFRPFQGTTASRSAVQTVKNDSGLKQEIEFETKLRDLLAEYGYSLRNIVSILDPQAAGGRKGAPVVPEKGTRRARTVKVYKNPHNAEIVETKGGNHKTLKAWKSEYGSEEVESWLAH